MNVLTATACLVEIDLQFAHGPGVADATNGSTLVKRRNGARPDDVVDGEFVAEDNLAVFIDIDDSGQAGIVEAEEVEERRVLAEAIGVVGIVHANFMIAKEEHEATAHVLLQTGAAPDIGFFFDLHGGFFLV